MTKVSLRDVSFRAIFATPETQKYKCLLNVYFPVGRDFDKDVNEILGRDVTLYKFLTSFLHRLIHNTVIVCKQYCVTVLHHKIKI